MSVSPPGHWLLNKMVFLINKTLGIINTTVENGILFLLKNSNTFTGINTFKGGINVDNITSINGNTTFNSEIIVNSNITSNNGTFIGNTMNIDDISLKTSSSAYITVHDVVRFNKNINVEGDLIVSGATTTVNSETLTINDQFITLNANIESSGKLDTDPAGIIVKTHNSSTLKNEGYLFWSLETPDRELNRTWDLSGDNLRGNVLKATTLRGNILESYYSPNISVISNIDMNNNNIYDVDTIFGNTMNIDVINTNTTSNISVMNTIDMNNNYIINAIISTNSPINVEGGLINTRNLILGEFDSKQPNGVLFRARNGLSPLETTKVVLESNTTLYLPENNGVPFGSNNIQHTQSIIGIGGLYKVQNNYQQFINSQCYLIPPSMVTDIPDLKGNTLFETIGEQTKNIRYLAGYPPHTDISINNLRNTLVPTVGQIVDLLTYLDVSMNTSKAGNLKSSYL